MSTFYPDYIRFGYTSLSYFAELLAGGTLKPFFKIAQSNLLNYYPLESEKLLHSDLEDHRASAISLEEARSYCVTHELTIPAKLKLSDNMEELILRVSQLERDIAEISIRLKTAESNLPEVEPASVLRAVGALAMLLAKNSEHKYQDKRTEKINPALAPIGEAIETMIENDFGKVPKGLASKTMQLVIRNGVIAFNERLQYNDNK